VAAAAEEEEEAEALRRELDALRAKLADLEAHEVRELAGGSGV
jgi:hypothetical protein